MTLAVMTVFLFIVGCGQKSNVQNSVSKENISSLTNSYHLHELDLYFMKKTRNVPVIVWTPIQYEDARGEFPNYLLRKANDSVYYSEDLYYSVYSVEEGGYYYVFWSNLGFKVWAIYLKHTFELRDFETLSIGSIYQDLQKIDPRPETNATPNSFTYSMLSTGELFRCTYERSGGEGGYYQMTIIDISVVNELEQVVGTAGYLLYIEKEDLPQGVSAAQGNGRALQNDVREVA